MKLLFWNCRKTERYADIASLINYEDIDVAFFAEASEEMQNEILNILSNYVAGKVNSVCKKIVYIHKKRISSSAVREQGRYVITKIEANSSSLLIGAVHMRDKINSKDFERINDCALLAGDMREAENEYQLKDSLVIGDFNCNPWEPPMTSKYALNAVMYKDIIWKHAGRCVYNGVHYHYYYNPMLSWISEEEEKYGSIYNSSDVDTIYWNVFDQVLVRPSLVTRLSRVDFIKEYCGICLVSCNGIPKKEVYSDHLPLIVEVLD